MLELLSEFLTTNQPDPVKVLCLQALGIILQEPEFSDCVFNRTKILDYIQSVLAKPQEAMAYEVFNAVQLIFYAGAKYINCDLFGTFALGLARYLEIFEW